MRNITIVIFCLLILGCKSSSKKTEWETYDLGAFTITLPFKPNIENIDGIDSYVAKIKGDSISLMFDFGMYSPTMTLTEKEYIDDREWLRDDKFFLIFCLTPTPTPIKVDKINDTTYQVIFDAREAIRNDTLYRNIKESFDSSFIIKDSTIESTFVIPDKIRSYDFLIEENDSIYKKIFTPKQSNKSKSGVYILNKNSCEDKSNCREILSIWTTDSVKYDNDKLLKIFKSIELK